MKFRGTYCNAHCTVMVFTTMPTTLWATSSPTTTVVMLMLYLSSLSSLFPTQIVLCRRSITVTTPQPYW